MDLITVAEKENGAFGIKVRGHEVVCDLSAKDGGTDAGPSPAELVAGAFGACVALMVRKYCAAHGYTDGKVEVNLTLELADDPKRVAAITADVEVPADVPENRKEALKRVAAHCPIHETFANPPRLDVEIM